MQKLLTLLIVFGSASLFVACTNSSPGTDTTVKDSASSKMEGQKTSFNLEAARTIIKEANSRFVDALKKGDSVSMNDNYASDALVMPPHSEPVSKKDMTSAFARFIKMGLKDFKLNTEDVSGDSDLLIETGSYEMDLNNNKVLDKGKYVVVWKPESGNWKIFRDIWNTSLPPAAAK